jgi:hypothetical protein
VVVQAVKIQPMVVEQAVLQLHQVFHQLLLILALLLLVEL